MSSVVNGGQHQHQPMISPVIKEVELFVKAGKNGESLAGCPVCQRFFMVLLIKAEHNRDMSLVVTTVNTARPPPELVAVSKRNGRNARTDTPSLSLRFGRLRSLHSLLNFYLKHAEI